MAYGTLSDKAGHDKLYGDDGRDLIIGDHDSGADGSVGGNDQIFGGEGPVDIVVDFFGPDLYAGKRHQQECRQDGNGTGRPHPQSVPADIPQPTAAV